MTITLLFMYFRFFIFSNTPRHTRTLSTGLRELPTKQKGRRVFQTQILLFPFFKIKLYKRIKMPSNKQVLDILPSKGAYPVAVGDEQSRNWTERQWDYQLQKEGATYDRSRTHLNFEIAPGGKIVPMGTNKKIGDRFKDRCAELGLGDPNFKIDKETGKLIPTNRVTTAWVQFGGSREQMHTLAYGNQHVDFSEDADNSTIIRQQAIEQWALAQYRFACRKWGEENIIGFNVHLDELNPHAHCTVIPVATIKGKPNISFNSVFYTPKTMKERLSVLHDELAAVNKPFGLERGSKVSETGAKHRTKEEYLREKAQMEKAIKGLTTMLANLSTQRKELLAEIENLEHKKDVEVDNYEKRLADLQEMLKMVQSQIDAKQQLLSTRQTQLNVLDRRIQCSQEKAEKIERAVHSAINVVSPARMLAVEVMVDELVDSMRDVWANTRTTVPEDNYMDESFAAAALSYPAGIAKCGLLLFCGLVDDATTFAKSNGGGGGSQSDLPWRDRDEDDVAFMRRCMLTAHRMMKPRGGYKLKRSGGGRGI